MDNIASPFSEKLTNTDPLISYGNIYEAEQICGSVVGLIINYHLDKERKVEYCIVNVFFYKGGCYTAYGFHLDSKKEFAKFMALVMVAQEIQGWSASGKDEKYMETLFEKVDNETCFVIKTYGNALLSCVKNSNGMIALNNQITILEENGKKIIESE